jgi:uncharacterized membrane protein
MGNLRTFGRIFYGISMAGIGVLSMYYRRLPYILSPPAKFPESTHALLASIFGALLIFTGTGIVLYKMTRPLSLLLGWALLAIGCFYCIPAVFTTDHHYLQFPEWENAEKVLALAAGAFVVAGTISGERYLRLGSILFALMILCFGILHFVVAVEASGYVPAWIPYHVFWMYFCGAALFGSGLAIIIKFKPGLFAGLLGAMILIWFVILHMPRVLTADANSLNSELASAFLALAYCGTAFVISGVALGRTAAASHQPAPGHTAPAPDRTAPAAPVTPKNGPHT